jgi:hypothetical protein
VSDNRWQLVLEPGLTDAGQMAAVFSQQHRVQHTDPATSNGFESQTQLECLPQLTEIAKLRDSLSRLKHICMWAKGLIL